MSKGGRGGGTREGGSCCGLSGGLCRGVMVRCCSGALVAKLGLIVCVLCSGAL